MAPPGRAAQGGGALQRLQFSQRVGVEKARGSSPGVSNGTVTQRCWAVQASILRPPAWVKRTRPEQVYAQQAKHRLLGRNVMWPVPSSSGLQPNGNVGLLFIGRPAGRLARPSGKKRVSRHGEQPGRFAVFQPGQKTGQGPA